MGNVPPAPESTAVRQAIKSATTVDSLDPITKATLQDRIADTDLKKIYAKAMLWILGGQLIAMNIIFIAVGLGCIKYSEPSYLQIFMGGTLAEVFGIVLVITRYLFSKKHQSIN